MAPRFARRAEVPRPFLGRGSFLYPGSSGSSGGARAGYKPLRAVSMILKGLALAAKARQLNRHGPARQRHGRAGTFRRRADHAQYLSPCAFTGI